MSSIWNRSESPLRLGKAEWEPSEPWAKQENQAANTREVSRRVYIC